MKKRKNMTKFGDIKLGSPSGKASEILNILTIRAGWIKFSEWVDIKIKLNLRKIDGSKIGGFPQTGPSKIHAF